MSNAIADLVKAEVAKILQFYRDKAADGLTLAEGWALIQLALASLVQIAEQVKGVSGEEKKAAVLAAIEPLVDSLLDKWDISWIPNALEKLTVDPLLKKIAMSFADGAIDSIVTVFNRDGGWLPKPEVPDDAADSGPSFPGLPEGWQPY